MSTPHFQDAEFACHDGTACPLELAPNLQQLQAQLEVIRARLAAPVAIVSGYRSPAHNAIVDGAGHSQHMLAKAADIRVEGYTPREVCTVVKSLIEGGHILQGGAGLYDGWVHYDIRGTAARWGGA